MVCPKCGTVLTDGANFCPECGTAIPKGDPNPSANTYENANTNADTNANTDAYVHAEPYQSPNAGTYTNADPYRGNNSGYVYEQPVRFDCGLEQRDLAKMLILSIVTFGLYGIYWFIKLVDDVNRASNDQAAFSGGVTWLLSFVTGGLYGMYWYYQAGKKMTYAKEIRHMPTDSNIEILYLLLGVFRFGIVAKCLIQSDLNKMA